MLFEGNYFLLKIVQKHLWLTQHGYTVRGSAFSSPNSEMHVVLLQ